MSATSLVGTSVASADANPTTPGAAEQQQQNTPVAKRGWLGVKIQSIDEDTAAALGLSDANGALVTEVMPDGPAAMAGLKVNDAILTINGQTIADGKDLARHIASQNPDSAVDLKIRSTDNEQTIKVKLGAFAGVSGEAAKSESSASPNDGKSPRLGLMLAKGAQGEGVLIAEVDPNSDAAGKGLTSGDVILQVNGKVVSSAEQVIESLKTVQDKGRKAVLLFVKSGDETRSVSVRFSVVG
jgi:serine protease Do